jgi:hypothetical protein
VSDILKLLGRETFLRRVQQALITRALVTPTGTEAYVASRTRYNNAVLRVPDRSASEAVRLSTMVVQDPTVDAEYTLGGLDGIAQTSIETVVETQVAATSLRDYALTITMAENAALIQDIAGGLATLAVAYATSPVYDPTTHKGSTMHAWLRLHVTTRQACVETAGRIAHLVLSDSVLLDELSMGGPLTITGERLREACARVLDAVVALEGASARVVGIASSIKADALRGVVSS